jgi:hypothetical protein
MANTFTLIASSSNFEDTTALAFSSIPQTYTDLMVILSVRGKGYNGSDMSLKFNGSSSNYVSRYFWKDGNSSSATSEIGGTTSAFVGIIPGLQAGSNAYGMMSIYIPNYASGSLYKSLGIETISERNGNDQWLFIGSSLWNDSSPITSLIVTCAQQYTGANTAHLYGIKNS